MSAPTMSDAEWAANQERYERVLKVITDAEATSTALREMREALMESVNVLLPMARAWVDHVEAPNDRKEVERIAGLLCAAIERSTKL